MVSTGELMAEEASRDPTSPLNSGKPLTANDNYALAA